MNSESFCHTHGRIRSNAPLWTQLPFSLPFVHLGLKDNDHGSVVVFIAILRKQGKRWFKRPSNNLATWSKGNVVTKWESMEYNASYPDLNIWLFAFLLPKISSHVGCACWPPSLPKEMNITRIKDFFLQNSLSSSYCGAFFFLFAFFCSYTIISRTRLLRHFFRHQYFQASHN